MLLSDERPRLWRKCSLRLKLFISKYFFIVSYLFANKCLRLKYRGLWQLCKNVLKNTWYGASTTLTNYSRGCKRPSKLPYRILSYYYTHRISQMGQIDWTPSWSSFSLLVMYRNAVMPCLNISHKDCGHMVNLNRPRLVVVYCYNDPFSEVICFWKLLFWVSPERKTELP